MTAKDKEEEEDDEDGDRKDQGYNGAVFYDSKAPLVTNEMFSAYRDATTTFYAVEDTKADTTVLQQESVYNRDWEINELLQFNSRFQQAVQVLNSDAWENAPNEILSAARSLITVSQDFLFSARTYGKIIISGALLARRQKDNQTDCQRGRQDWRHQSMCILVCFTSLLCPMGRL